MDNSPMKDHLTKANQQVVADEAAAEVREGARQAAIERERVIRCAREAEAAAAQEGTAEAATLTFRERFMEIFR